MTSKNPSRVNPRKSPELNGTDQEGGELTALLEAWGAGDLQARDELMPLVYRELRRRAAAYLRRERADHTLQPTALIHEAYLRLVGQQRVDWRNRAQFFALASQMMRRILIDHARAQQAAKRPTRALKVTVDENVAQTESVNCDVVLLNQALEELSSFDPQQGTIVELRHFGGLSETEVAQVLGVSRSTVTREWQTARAWLFRRMTSGRSTATP